MLRWFGFKKKTIITRVGQLNGHTSYISTLVVLPDGRLASGSYDNTIRIWDIESRRCVATLTGHTIGISSLQVLPDGRLASGSWDNTIRIWDLKSHLCLAVLSEHTEWIDTIQVLSDGRLASGSWDKTIRIWDLKSHSCVAILEGHTKAIQILHALHDGRLVSGSWDNTIRIWDTQSHSCVATLEGHTGFVHTFQVLLDGRLASGSYDSSIRIWDLESYRCIGTLKKLLGGRQYSILMLPDGRVAGGASNKIRIWDPESHRCVATLEGHTSKVTVLKVLPDGRLASGSRDYTIRIWDLDTLQCVATLTGHTGRIVTLQALPDGRLASGARDHTIAFWDISCHPALKASTVHEATSDESANQYPKHAVHAGLSVTHIGKPALAVARGAEVGLAANMPLTSVPSILADAIKLDRVTPLGQGGFGIVYKGTWQMVTVAVKQLHATRLSPEALVSFKEEAQRHGLLRHPNVVMLFGVCLEPARYSMVMEFMSRGSLYDFLHGTQDILWSVRLAIAKNITVGLSYLHENKIIHRDLKSLNVLLDDRMQPKLADFGLSTVKAETQSTATLSTYLAPGTIRWMAPELFRRGAKCNYSSDIYALGWVFWELCARKIPFQDEAHATPELIKDWIKAGERAAIPATTPPKFAHLLTKCWDQRAERRPDSVKRIAEDLECVNDLEAVSSGYVFFSRR